MWGLKWRPSTKWKGGSTVTQRQCAHLALTVASEFSRLDLKLGEPDPRFLRRDPFVSIWTPLEIKVGCTSVCDLVPFSVFLR